MGARGPNGRERPKMADACRGARGRERTASGYPKGSSGRAGIRSAPTGVEGGPVPACCRGHSQGQLGGPLGSPHGICTGGLGDGERLSGSPCH